VVIGVVRDRIAAGGDRFLAKVFLGAGLLFMAMPFAAGAVAGGIVLTADDRPAAEVWSFSLAPRWLTVLDLSTGVVLLVSAGFMPSLEVVFPAWLFVFSVHILVAPFRPADPTVG
jgi:hypothetical protein